MRTGTQCEHRAIPWAQRLEHARPRRVLLLLAAVWIIQGFDLGFTVFAYEYGMFQELNPLGAWALQYGPIGAILFKAAMLAFSSVILWCFRKRLLSECLLWLVVFACVGLALRWQNYIEILAENPANTPLGVPDRCRVFRSASEVDEIDAAVEHRLFAESEPDEPLPLAAPAGGIEGIEIHETSLTGIATVQDEAVLQP
ncbi:MAG: hypothetical protein JXA69_13050 [Phycisphaerae bacterium]|nr:hypothetical protein [Phycisphaerae bacterium]